MSDSRRFEAYGEQVGDYVGQLFTRAIQGALLDGLEMAVKATFHDSSNAAAHWMLAGADGNKSRPWQRKLGRITDMRGTLGIRGPARSPVFPVGYQGDEGINEGDTVKFVRQRELAEVIHKLVTGRKPEFRFYLFNAVGGDENYAGNANIEQAGQAGLDRILASATRRIAAGQTRKVPLK
ncbi:hypothetical protein D9M71_494100 [compost metagenome]